MCNKVEVENVEGNKLLNLPEQLTLGVYFTPELI
jgi:hypothetical protein